MTAANKTTLAVARRTIAPALLVFTLLTGVLPDPVSASEVTSQTTAGTEDFAQLRAKLKENVPELKVDEIRSTPIPNLFAVVSGRSTVIYVDGSGEFVLTGHLFTAKTKQDLTGDLLANLSKVDPSKLPLADSFTEVRGKGTRQLYVFSDPDCPYCKKLEQELPSLTDVTIHVFLFPLVDLHPTAKTNAERVWCASDRSKAWSDKLLNDVVPPEATCANPIARNLALGGQLGINATPTLIFADGSVVPGAIPAERIEQLLDKSK